MKADKLYLGNIITMADKQMTAEAVAVSNGKILFVGSSEDAQVYVGQDTEVIDYGDMTIYPGFIETHCHPLMAGTRLNLQADLSDGECLQDYLDTLKKWIEDHPGRPNYQGAGWKIIDFAPHKSILDEICPDVPMILNSFDGHSAWLNSAAIAEFKIDENKIAEFGTDLVRVDENGDVTGYISEKPAFDLISSLFATLTPELIMESLVAWQNFAFSQGITACQDAGFTETGIKLMAAMADKDMLRIRTSINLLVDEQKDTDMQAIVDKACQLAQYDSEYAKIKGIKLFVDGVVEAHTGWLIDEYADAPGYFGIQRFADPENMKELAIAAAEKNLFIHTHCIGDAATKYVVDGIEAARQVDGRLDQRNAIAHLQIVRPEDVQRMADLNITAVVAPLWVPKGVAPEQDKLEIASLGEERYWNEYPINSFMEAGGMIAFHTDYPVSPVISVPRSVYMAVTRCNPDDPASEPKNAPECISRIDALKAMTVNPAIQVGELENMGTLEAGKIANMAVYNSDFLNDELQAVAKAQLQATIVDGEIVFAC